MLGLSKGFVIVLALATIIGFGTHSFINFLTLVVFYAIIRIIYKLLT
jgi:hypothetical protein